MAIRLFVAVDVAEDVRRAAATAAAPLRERFPDLKWTDPRSWHLTLAFLGWVDEGLVEPIHQALEDAARGAEPFDLRLQPVAGGTRSGVLWVELEPSEELASLAARVGAGLGALGLELEQRPFRAHLTLARSRARRAPPRELLEAYAGPVESWTVRELVLYRSHLGRAGARYESLAAVPLRSWEGFTDPG